MDERSEPTPQSEAAPELEPKGWALPFFTLWTGQALSLVGSSVGGFALVWWLTRETGSATVLAFSSLVAMLPGVFLGPIAGALVDRWSRRRVMILADSLVAFFSAVLALLSLLGRLEVWHIYVIVFIRSLGGTFHWAAMQAATSLMVPRTQLSRVAGMNQTLQGVLSIITPPLGALLMELLALHEIMAIDVVTAAFAVGPLFFIAVPEPLQTPSAATRILRTLAEDIKEGFVYLWSWSGMFLILVVAAVLNGVTNPAFSLMPILVRRHFGGGALELGWMESAWGIGMILGGVVLSLWGGFKRRIFTSMAGLLLAGIAFALVGVAPATALTMALGGMVMAGFSNPIINGPFFAVIQDVVDPKIQGRVFTVIGSMTGAAAPIGMAIAGPAADAFGVQVWFLLAGAISVLMALGLRAVPAVAHLEDHGRRIAAAGVTKTEAPDAALESEPPLGADV